MIAPNALGPCAGSSMPCEQFATEAILAGPTVTYEIELDDLIVSDDCGAGHERVVAHALQSIEASVVSSNAILRGLALIADGRREAREFADRVDHQVFDLCMTATNALRFLASENDEASRGSVRDDPPTVFAIELRTLEPLAFQRADPFYRFGNEWRQRDWMPLALSIEPGFLSGSAEGGAGVTPEVRKLPNLLSASAAAFLVLICFVPFICARTAIICAASAERDRTVACSAIDRSSPQAAFA